MPSRLCVPLMFLAVMGCATAPVSTTVRDPNTIIFGLATYGGTQLGEKDANALSATLSKRLGEVVTVLAFSDESSLADALVQGSIDAAWMPPLSFTAARSRADVTPLAMVVRHGVSHYRGVIFARSDSSIRALQDLHGKTMAWVDRRSAAGYTFPRALFQMAKLKPEEVLAKEEFLGDHAAVCRAVLEKRADAGATFMDDLPDGTQRIDGCVQALGGEEAAKLAVVAVSRPIPNDVVVVRAGYSTDKASSLKGILLNLTGDDDGKATLGAVFKAEGFTTVDLSEFGFTGGQQ